MARLGARSQDRLRAPGRADSRVAGVPVHVGSALAPGTDVTFSFGLDILADVETSTPDPRLMGLRFARRAKLDALLSS